MNSLKNIKKSKKAAKKIWIKPVVKEVQSLLQTKAGQWGADDGNGDGSFIS